MAQPDPNSAAPEAGGPPVGAPDIGLLFIALAELRPEFSVRDLLGERVRNDAGEDIGALDDLLVEDDQVAFAVLSVGGFLGLGAHRVVAPFEALLLNDGDIVLPGASREVLARMAAYDREQVRMERRAARRRRHDEAEVVQTAGGEPIPRSVTEITDGEV
ncbi:MAG TPA: PRC-barrel domain-containing protein [Caulobacteraceae bacterium]